MLGKNFRSIFRLVTWSVLLLCAASCIQTVEDHHGCRLQDSGKIGVGQSKSKVTQTLGSPTMVSGFDSNVWYYIGIDTTGLSGQKPNHMRVYVIEAHFDPYYEIVTAVHSREKSVKLGRVPYVDAKDLETFRILRNLENAAASLQPTPIK
jgi:outer membrane protein assembly factor BamE (lipoprotein component of BamABCDE complex)